VSVHPDQEPRTAPEPAALPDAPEQELRDYRPIHPTASGRQRRGGGIIGAIIAAAVAIAKFGVLGLKFGSVFIAVGGYTLLWGWRFAVGFVALIAIHELGHVFEARRQGLHVTWPTFIPFFGAYVRHSPASNPFNAALISLSGPFWGGIGCAALLVVGRSTSSPLVQALAYTGFLINLINLIPVGFLDGGQTLRSYRALKSGGDSRASLVMALLVGLALLLAAGMFVAHVHQTRL